MTANTAAFHTFSASHWAVLALTAAAATWMVRCGRTDPNSHILRRTEILLAIALLAHWPLDVLAKLATGTFGSWQEVLPMYLCNWACVACGIALLTHRRIACELAWFWGIAATLQGLLTPALLLDFPHPAWFTFFLQHSGVVIAAVALVFGRQIKPTRGSWWLAILGTEAYFFAALGTNSLLGTNYGFLNETPSQPSLLDWMGTGWTYLLAIQAAGFIAMTLLWLPFQKRAANQ
ncbi:TIGR02206 family membrane protein [Sulfuriroseicoccus oceanibius]|uniref:TIGR02206 family membrane protein n=1 Tax=Sulfuriroseicoccus oceanibius TaxID=2707525 RepID=A0A6B3L5D3_9BACT|nr:TIGR02206 family membrane protein [Sulfuriroseicoccus oceanibius]QQL44954.1 TIGR02206 family membrane protein [Sulfuriroseicoccus oceanibius]